MAISEAQLQTWSAQGSVTQSAQTYETIRGVLDDRTSPYYPKIYRIFLQGSYGNDTNIYSDSRPLRTSLGSSGRPGTFGPSTMKPLVDCRLFQFLRQNQTLASGPISAVR